jgi:hypothetical protein
MNSRLFLLAFATVLFFGARLTADEPAKKQATEEEIKARLAEHARKHAMKSAELPQKGTAAEAAAGTAQNKSAAGTGTGAPVNPKNASATPNAANTPPAPTPAQEPASVLPKVEVKRDRITELDRQLEKQNAEIAREKVNTKPTALDDTLNGGKISKTLAIFGGQSSDDRANVAKERVAMMEEERELIEAISQAQSKEEKEELQKTLDAMRAMRRDLEASLR